MPFKKAILVLDSAVFNAKTTRGSGLSIKQLRQRRWLPPLPLGALLPSRTTIPFAHKN